MAQRVTRLDYCQFLLSSQINYTLTYFADHSQGFTHDLINRYLRQETMTPRLLWDNVKDEIVPSANGFILFDDRVGERRQVNVDFHPKQEKAAINLTMGF